MFIIDIIKCMYWYNEIGYQINTVLCLIKVNSYTIEFAVHTSCYCISDLLCVSSLFYVSLLLFLSFFSFIYQVPQFFFYIPSSLPISLLKVLGSFKYSLRNKKLYLPKRIHPGKRGNSSWENKPVLGLSRQQVVEFEWKILATKF